ncbi:MAG: M3 family oligoendopeptidase [Bacteroidetes bacterium]|jgi:oligoendopeptidase F|nr:M3 family oligoendopeptidase [Bacteroidota bacterium]
MTIALENIGKVYHKYLKPEFSITCWDDLKPYYDDLNNRPLLSEQEMMQWLQDRSELESALQEDFAWRYIRMSCDNTNKTLQQEYTNFVRDIEPLIAPEENKLNQKLLDCPFHEKLANTEYKNYIRSIKQRVEIFREENIHLQSELSDKQQLFGQISGTQTIENNGHELTLPQASALLKSTDRNLRENIYRKITERRLKDKATLDQLYTELIALRNQIALNAGFKNYRDYSFVAMNRFDYTPADCFRFHDSIESAILPLVNDLEKNRKKTLGYDELRPWDLAVDPTGKTPLKPFENSKQMVEKTICCMDEIDSELAQCISLLDKMNRFDLDSRKGKSPGGYNYPLYESGVPFIFMNSTGQLRDLVTMVHESGHAVHAILAHKLPFHELKSCPSEVAELASMSMELITMEHWHLFFSDAEELRRAKLEHLSSLIDILPWIAVIDAFQHWVYENPTHTVAERESAFNKIYTRYSGKEINWTGLENVKANLWQKQIHVFDSPFYYIEYGMAQLGAIAIWKNYRENPEKTIRQYKEALTLGYTQTIGEIYNTAGIRFDFSAKYISELAQFISEEIKKLN